MALPSLALPSSALPSSPPDLGSIYAKGLEYAKPFVVAEPKKKFGMVIAGGTANKAVEAWIQNAGGGWSCVEWGVARALKLAGIKQATLEYEQFRGRFDLLTRLVYEGFMKACKKKVPVSTGEEVTDGYL